MLHMRLILEQSNYPGTIEGMSVEEICAWCWTCDRCHRKKLLPGNDKQPPTHWIADGLFTFCSYAHYREFLKIIADARDV